MIRILIKKLDTDNIQSKLENIWLLIKIKA